MGRNREPVQSLVLYQISKWSVVSPLLYTYFRGHIYGAENVPQDRSFIAVSNHASYFDPPILACAVGRPVAFMAKEELFEVPVLKQAISLYGAYPVKRTSADRSAIRSALKSLEDGWATGVFLQGTRTQDGRITQPKLGAATIAAKAKVPVLPVCLWGTQGILKSGSPLPRPASVTVRIGQLFDPPKSSKREDLEALTQQWTDTINTLYDLGR
jgi:1-acyl-sn-glycerol-3-phosphate acyltransferase